MLCWHSKFETSLRQANTSNTYSRQKQETFFVNKKINASISNFVVVVDLQMFFRTSPNHRAQCYTTHQSIKHLKTYFAQLVQPQIVCLCGCGDNKWPSIDLFYQSIRLDILNNRHEWPPCLITFDGPWRLYTTKANIAFPLYANTLPHGMFYTKSQVSENVKEQSSLSHCVATLNFFGSRHFATFCISSNPDIFNVLCMQHGSYALRTSMNNSMLENTLLDNSNNTHLKSMMSKIWPNHVEWQYDLKNVCKMIGLIQMIANACIKCNECNRAWIKLPDVRWMTVTYGQHFELGNKIFMPKGIHYDSFYTFLCKCLSFPMCNLNIHTVFVNMQSCSLEETKLDQINRKQGMVEIGEPKISFSKYASLMSIESDCIEQAIQHLHRFVTQLCFPT